ILDPIWTTAYITRNHGYMIFDTLFALDGNLKLQPQMVDKYTVSKDAMKYSFTLRDGLKFHDGQPVTAEDCVASIKRWGAKDAMGRLLIASLSRMASTDRKTFVIELETPFGLVLDALGKPSASPSFIMPARVAATDPNEQVKDIIGNEKYFRTCPSVFMCGGLPYESSAGAPKPDLERARALFKESGYDGRPVVVLDPTDSPYAHAPALVTMEMLKSIGANVDLHAMDWSTMVSRRAKKEPPAQGGWNVFHTWSTSFDTMTPAVSSVLGGAGEKAWFGWPTSEAMEKLRADFAREPNEAKRKAIAEKVQVLAYDEVPYVPWGQFVI